MDALFLALLLSAAYCSALPIGSDADSEERDAKYAEEYLKNFYNLQSSGVHPAREFVEKISEMQQFFNLKVTGKLDSDTMEMMQQPRCGFVDVAEYSTFPGNPTWKKRDLTYRIVNYSPDMPIHEVDLAIQRAFLVWSDVVSFTFTRIYNDVSDIEISFEPRFHNDNNPFDGPYGTLAHAYAPGGRIGGDVHFDEDEMWTLRYVGINLFLVAAHELGHSLGLLHSRDPGALMFPTYSFTEPSEFRLSSDDIKGIQSLYGARVIPDQPTVPDQPNQPNDPSNCRPDMTFDAVTTLRGEILFFKDEALWRQISQNSEVGHHSIRSLWSSVPTHIQAAYEYVENDQVLIFKGDKYWIVSAFNVVEDSPKSIYQLGFPRTVQKIDAAVHDETSGKTYFFVDDKYWSYNEATQSMDAGSPKQITDGFPGIGTKIHAAFQKDSFLYFFDGQQQYKFSTAEKRVTRILKNNSWLNCNNVQRYFQK